MSFSDFLRRLGNGCFGGYTFLVIAEEEAAIDRSLEPPWRASPASTARVLEELVGFNVLTGGKFDYGVAHPEAVGSDPGVEMARHNVGASMVDAFSPFERAFRHEFRRVRFEQVFRGHKRDCNIITFGSPSSNDVARGALGFVQDETDEFRLNYWFTDNHYPVRYELSESEATVRRNSGRYLEPRWSIDTPAGRLRPQLAANGALAEDFLVISCVPNLVSPGVPQALDARIELNRLRDQPNFYSRMAASRDLQAKVNDLERIALDDSEMHRVVVIGGLHGPGTGAARMLLSDRQRATELDQAVKRAGADGKFWQAVVRVSEVAVDPKTGRDVPVKLDDRIDVFPVIIG
jgi:hypothetical protein